VIELYYSPLDLAAVLRSFGLGARGEAELLERLWTYDRSFLSAKYRDDKRNLILDIDYWQHYLNDKPAIDAEFPAIQNDLRSLGSHADAEQFLADNMDLDLFFKSMRIRILFVGKQDYTRIKLRTLLKAYGYQRRSEKLLAYIKECLTFFHLEPFLRGEPCEINEISLDDMITFRIP